MKVVCESCQAKYQVPDERVAGKKLKIRCKRCGATVLIRGDLATVAAANGGDSVPAFAATPSQPPPAATTLEWHVSRDGDTRGPFDTEQLRVYLSSEPGGWDAHVWREGFPDWLEARACAELSAPPEPVRPAYDPSQEDDGPTQTFGSAALHAAPLMAQAAAARRAGTTTLVGDARASAIRPRSTSSISTASSPHLTAESLIGERHEDSVLFSSQSAQSLSSSSAASAYVPGPNPGFAGGEGSGLIDIRALASLTRQTAPRIAPHAVAAASPSTQTAGYAGSNALSFGEDEEDPRVALLNQNSAFGRVDSLAPVSTASQTSSVAVPLAIVGGCALVAAAILLAILFVRPNHPPEAVAVGASPETESTAAMGQPTNPEPDAPPPSAAEEEKAAAPEPPVAVASADDEKNELASTKPKRQPHMPRTAAEDKKSGAPEEKAKPKKEEKAEPPSSDEVMLAERAKPRPSAAAAAVAAENAKQEKASNGAATEIDQLLATKPAKQPAKSRSIDDLLEGADKGAAAKSASAATAPASAVTTTPAANPAASGADDSDLPDSPSRDEILAAMRGVESQVRGCAEGQQIQGTAEVALSIAGTTGRITNAIVNGITGSVGSCIARAVRNAKFPRFKKPNFSIKYPYRF